MKIYQKPITDIDIVPQWEGHFMASGLEKPTGDKLGGFGGLPIWGGTLKDPSFGNSTTFSRYSVWMEDEEIDEAMRFDKN